MEINSKSQQILQNFLNFIGGNLITITIIIICIAETVTVKMDKTCT